MNDNASLALKEAAKKLDVLAADEKDGDKIRLVGGLILDIVAAVLHQWDAKKGSEQP